LINNPDESVNEVVKIEKDDITFIKDYLICTIPLDSLHKAHDCEITIVSLTFYFKSKPREVRIDDDGN